MSTHIRENNIQVVSAEDLTAADKKYKLLSIAGTITNNTRVAAGLLVTSCKSGQHASACIDGITKAWAAAAVNSIGWPWMATTSGFTTNATSGSDTGGRYLETCNSGDIVRVTVDLGMLGYQPL